MHLLKRNLKKISINNITYNFVNFDTYRLTNDQFNKILTPQLSVLSQQTLIQKTIFIKKACHLKTND